MPGADGTGRPGEGKRYTDGTRCSFAVHCPFQSRFPRSALFLIIYLHYIYIYYILYTVCIHIEMLSMCSISLFLILLNILGIQNEDAISQAAAFCGRRAALEEMAEVAAVKLEATRP